MPHPLATRRTLPVLWAAGVVLAACRADAPRGPAQPGDYRGAVLSPPLPAADFTLSTTDGRPFHFREQTNGVVGLLFFGYTTCPDVCPVHMANLAAVLPRLPHDVSRRVKVVFVTVDPDRDTPARLRSWLDTFDPKFVGLHGPADVVNGIQQSLRMPPTQIQPLPDGGVAVGHGAAVIAVVGDSMRVLYPFGTRQKDWSHDLPKLVASIPRERRE
jgi:protein SCO1/2